MTIFFPTPNHTIPVHKGESQFAPTKKHQNPLVKQIKQSIFAPAKQFLRSEKSSEHADNTKKTTKKVFKIFLVYFKKGVRFAA